MKGSRGKNFAKLALFFSYSFILLFIGAGVYQFLVLWIDAVRMIPPPQNAASQNLINAMIRAVPAALYLSVLFSLSYTARKGMGIPFSVFWIFILAGGFTLGFSLGVRRMTVTQPAPLNVSVIRGEEGLILSRLDTDIILVKKPEDVQGPRVVSIAGKPLFYQKSPRGPNNALISLPPLPFRYDYAWFFQSLLIDFNLSARNLDSRLKEGLVPFCVYGGALVFLLASLRFIFSLGHWPLANLLWGCLAFRGVLGLETFINSREIQEFLGKFLDNRIPASFISPAVFTALGLLILLYTVLVYAGWKHLGRD